MQYRNDTLCGMFHNQALRFRDSFPFLTGKYNPDGSPADVFRSMSWQETRSAVLALARGLMAMGVEQEDKVMIFAESRPRWVIADQAIQACGAIGVPIYPTVSCDELCYMAENSDASIIITSTAAKAQEAVNAFKGNQRLSKLPIITMAPCLLKGVQTFEQVMNLGREHVPLAKLEERLQAVTPEHVASIIYTSGTTGHPKGVVLTQANWVSNIYQVGNADIFKRQNELELHLRCIVHLPLCHVYGRTGDYHVVGLLFGGELAFAQSFNTIADDLRELRPNVITSIPRFYEKVYDIVHSTAARSRPYQRALFNWARRSGNNLVQSMATGRPMNPWQLLNFALANMIVYDPLKRSLGMDRVVFSISGGGKLSKEVCEFFRATTLQLNEGYGLTETSPVINLNEPNILFAGELGRVGSFLYDKLLDMTTDLMVTRIRYGKSPFRNPIAMLKLGLCYYTLVYRMRVKPGTVGRPVKWTEQKIAEDGEILVRGPQIFRTYWRRPDADAEVFTDDGWFRTGDIGRFDHENFLEITDRKKEIFVTSGGKNIAPHPIEVALISRPFIDQACMVGDGRKYLCALIVPDIETIRRHAKKHRISFESNDDLLDNPTIQKLVQDQVERVNDKLARYEQVKYYTILKEPFSEETGELTPTLKVKRRVVNEKYKDLIEGMY